MNIIINENYEIKSISHCADKKYDLSELWFYIPNIFNCCSIYISLSQGSLIDIIPLQFIKTHNSHKVYKFNYSNRLRIPSGVANFKIMLVDQNNNCNISVNGIDIDILVDNYDISHKLSIIKELETSIQGLYEKIVSITNMNIEMYEKLNKDGD